MLIVITFSSYRNISPTHPSMMPAGIPPIRGVSGAGARVPLRGPMGRGEYGKCFHINHNCLKLFVSFEKILKRNNSLCSLANSTPLKNYLIIFSLF